MKVVLSGQARAYIQSETAYLRKHSRQAALNFRARLVDAFASLASFPDIGRDIARLPVPRGATARRRRLRRGLRLVR